MSFINDLYSLISNNIVLLMLIASFMGFFVLLVHGIFLDTYYIKISYLCL